MEEGTVLKRYKPYIIILIAVLLAEIFVFNWRFFEGIGYESVELNAYSCGSGVTNSGVNEITVLSGGDKYIEFTGFNTEVKNVYINIRDKRCDEPVEPHNGTALNFERLAVVPSITDYANAQPKEMPERYIVNGVERTKYLRLHTAGESDTLRLKFNGVDNQTLIIDSVVLNKQVPFSPNLIRILALFAIVSLIYAFRYGSPVYEISFNHKSYGQIWLVIVLMLANMILGSIIALANPVFDNPGFEHHHQYDYLAQSFMNGHVYLDYAQPPQALIDMENPYDKAERDRVMAQNGTTYKWDHAYYDGKYYVYFGALPVLTYYLPYRLATGEEFPTQAGVLLNYYIFVIFAFLLIRAVVKKWFKDISLGHYLILSQVFVASSGMIFAIRRPDLYFMPISMALALCVTGLYFWVSAFECRTKVMQGVKLFVGSLCMAAVSGCRPQFLIASFLAIPLFYKTVFKERRLFSKQSLVHTAVFVLPYIVCAAGVMWYNYARFGSVFDFGANYNLTTNDMTSRGFNLGRLPLGLFAYLFQLPVTYAKFPFITSVNLSNYYMGTTVTEMMLGGVVACQPVIWLIAGIKYCRRELKSKGLYALVICCLAFAVVVVAADTEMAGILYRYYADYSYLLILPAIIVALALCTKYTDKRVGFTVVGLSALSLVFDLALVFVSGDYYLDYANPNFYYAITSAITFWL